MKKGMKRLFTILGSMIGIFTIILVCLMIFGKGNLLMPVAKKEVFTNDNLSEYPLALQVEGNKIVNSAGETVVLKGLMVPEMQKLHSEGNFKESFFEEVFECGGNVIRIPIHPEKWVSDEYYLWRYLDSVVAWAGKYDKYVIIDLHFIGNIENGTGSEMVDVGEEPYEFSIEFWNTVATYFKDTPNVIFEIYNDPAVISGTQWRNRYGWKNELSTLADLYPIVVTEWGFISEEGLAKQSYLEGNRTTYGEPLIAYLEEHRIGWTACWYDDGWEPPMFLEGMKELTDWGQFVLEHLK